MQLPNRNRHHRFVPGKRSWTTDDGRRSGFDWYARCACGWSDDEMLRVSRSEAEEHWLVEHGASAVPGLGTRPKPTRLELEGLLLAALRGIKRPVTVKELAAHMGRLLHEGVGDGRVRGRLEHLESQGLVGRRKPRPEPHGGGPNPGTWVATTTDWGAP